MEVILQAVLGVADPAMRRRLRRLIDDTLGYPFGALRRRACGTAPRARAGPPRAPRGGGRVRGGAADARR